MLCLLIRCDTLYNQSCDASLLVPWSAHNNFCQFVWLIYYISNTVDHYEYIFDFSNAPKRSGYSFHDKIFAQWTFWYCNDIGVTSPSISLWHCWSIVNEHVTMSICNINLISRSWDWANQTLKSSWHRCDKKEILQDCIPLQYQPQ